MNWKKESKHTLSLHFHGCMIVTAWSLKKQWNLFSGVWGRRAKIYTHQMTETEHEQQSDGIGCVVLPGVG